MTNFKIHRDNTYSVVFPDIGGISVKTTDRKNFLKAMDSGASIKEWWVELEGKLEGRKPLPDLSQSLDCHIVMSPSSYDVLLSHLSAYGEFLPVPFKGECYQLFRCLNRIDKVDVDKSRFSEFDDPIELHFVPSDVEGQFIWTSIYKYSSGLFCGNEFKTIVEDAELTGLTFNENLASYS